MTPERCLVIIHTHLNTNSSMKLKTSQILSAVMGLSSHLRWSPFHVQQHPHVAEEEEETEEEEVTGHTHQGR